VGTVYQKNGRHPNQMKMQKLPERELNILRIILKRILREENNLTSHVLFFNPSAIKINEDQ